MPVREARRLLGDAKTIGGYAHTLEEVLAAYDDGADYVGLGPHKPTQTIRHSNQFLATSDYLRIAGELQKRNVDIPVIAAGGIKPDDVEKLLDTGIFGVAVSSAVNLSENPGTDRSEEHTTELQSIMHLSYAVLCLTKKKSSYETTQTKL